MYCSNCGNSIPENSKFCSGCGSSLNVNTKDDDNLIKLKKEAKWVNSIDESTITQHQDSILKVTTPPEDIQYLKCNGTSNIGLCLKKANGCTVYYFLNVNGEIKSKQYDWASQNFVHGYAKVKTGNLYGMVNTQGREVMPTAFSEIEIVEANTLTSYHLIKAKKNGCFGCFDLSGRIVIQFIYENIGKFRNGIVGVKYNDVYKFIDYKCNDVFPFNWKCHSAVLNDDKVYFSFNNISFRINEEGKLHLKQIHKSKTEPSEGLLFANRLVIFLLIVSCVSLTLGWLNDNDHSKPIFIQLLLIIIVLIITYIIIKSASKPVIIDIIKWIEKPFDYVKNS